MTFEIGKSMSFLARSVNICQIPQAPERIYGGEETEQVEEEHHHHLGPVGLERRCSLFKKLLLVSFREMKHLIALRESKGVELSNECGRGGGEPDAERDPGLLPHRHLQNAVPLHDGVLHGPAAVPGEDDEGAQEGGGGAVEEAPVPGVLPRGGQKGGHGEAVMVPVHHRADRAADDGPAKGAKNIDHFLLPTTK